MTAHPITLLLTTDPVLTRRLAGHLHGKAELHTLADPNELLLACDRYDPVTVLLDLSETGALDCLRAIRRRHPESPVIALGPERAEPALAAVELGVLAVHDPAGDRLRLAQLVRQAQAQGALVQDNRALRHAARPAVSAPPPARPAAAPAGPDRPLAPFAAVFRDAADTNALLGGLLDNIATTLGIARAGLFAVDRTGARYTLRAALRCLPDTAGLSVEADHELVRWMRLRVQLAARLTLPHVQPDEDRRLLGRWLDRLGAEAMLPLHGRDRLLGWIFLGHPASGIPFTAADLERLTTISLDASLVVENALLAEEAAVQRSLAETVLRGIPAGIVAIDDQRRVQWFNPAAETILGLPAAQALGQPPSCLGSRLADALLRAADGLAPRDPMEWTEPATRLPVAVVTRPLGPAAAPLGAVAIVQDLSRERTLRERQERVDRATFWTELAAAISHEVRNPLVAISTFAQLLPERYDDPEFRGEFATLAVREITRLNAMIDQINAFANPGELTFAPVDVAELLRRAARLAVDATATSIPVRTVASGPLPAVRGDGTALAEALAHLVTNAIEALQGRAEPSVMLTADAEGGHNGNRQVLVRVQDNGPGIPPEIVDKVFSPFCTIKARGIGLGLPIAKRTVTDHNGRLDIETGRAGTTVSVRLPVSLAAREPTHETAHSDCG